ncbi:hypothetical protein G4V62_10495 [Bacillaceae bacterium SIJ1]|uniref:hypothetical protein n=1 Tax=Litoribacterium kuwaitense TaxID=1398745 RepID=UPI0013EB0924|nr:hypothetical protein [Litoribacterium kuwaitense]NGP45360.1 hypothetical protein [Litoribacterium kuwaitense]
MKYHELIEKPLAEQEKLIRHWRGTMKTSEIIDMLDCPYYKLYSMMKKLGIPLREKKHSKRTVPVEEDQMKEYRKEVIPYTRFQLLPNHQKNELIHLYLEHHSAQQLAEKWEVSTATVYNQRRKIEREHNRSKKSEYHSPLHLQQKSTQLNQSVADTLALLKKTQSTPQHTHNQSNIPAESLPNKNSPHKMTFNIEGMFTTSQIIDKLNALCPFIEDRGCKYRLSLTIEETNEQTNNAPPLESLSTEETDTNHLTHHESTSYSNPQKNTSSEEKVPAFHIDHPS